MIQGTNTAGRLRLLADQIDKEEQPDFVLVIADGDLMTMLSVTANF